MPNHSFLDRTQPPCLLEKPLGAKLHLSMPEMADPMARSFAPLPYPIHSCALCKSNADDVPSAKTYQNAASEFYRRNCFGADVWGLRDAIPHDVPAGAHPYVGLLHTELCTSPKARRTVL